MDWNSEKIVHDANIANYFDIQGGISTTMPGRKFPIVHMNTKFYEKLLCFKIVFCT